MTPPWTQEDEEEFQQYCRERAARGRPFLGGVLKTPPTEKEIAASLPISQRIKWAAEMDTATPLARCPIDPKGLLQVLPQEKCPAPGSAGDHSQSQQVPPSNPDHREPDPDA